MVKCERCGKGVGEVILHRTKPMGQTDACWMCSGCIALTEPELSNNIKEDQVLKDLQSILYGTK